MDKASPCLPKLLDSQHSVLVLVDIQARLTSAMPSLEAEQMLIHTERLLEAATLLEVPVLVTEQYPQGLGATQSALIERLPPRTPVFAKTGFSCCLANGFQAALEETGRRQIILLGQEAHVCVLQTALELGHLGYQVHLVSDAVCSRRPEHKATALQRMQQQGIVLSCHESVLFEWLRDAGHPHFKKISALLR